MFQTCLILHSRFESNYQYHNLLNQYLTECNLRFNFIYPKRGLRVKSCIKMSVYKRLTTSELANRIASNSAVILCDGQMPVNIYKKNWGQKLFVLT